MPKTPEYRQRYVDEELRIKLQTTGAVVIRGPKWCGKTTTAKQQAASFVELQDQGEAENWLELAQIKPVLVLAGDRPRLLDEWQLAPNLWNSVRSEVDRTSSPGQFILTGSATPDDQATAGLHSGVGRFSLVEMKPMTLYESEDSTGDVSLGDILDGQESVDGATSELSYERLAFLTCRGGWPQAVNSDDERAIYLARGYVELLCDSDISRLDGVRRDPFLARTILQAYGRQSASLTKNKEIYADVAANFSQISTKTIDEYLAVLRRLYIIEEIPSWNPNIRSQTSIRTSNKKGLIDPSLALAALQITPRQLALDVKSFGLFFENLVSRDLSVYARVRGGILRHYRDRYGLECDNVIVYPDRRYGLVEVKLGSKDVPEAEKHLQELSDLIKNNQPSLGKPAYMMVVTGTQKSYTLASGIHVVPLGCLRA